VNKISFIPPIIVVFLGYMKPALNQFTLLIQANGRLCEFNFRQRSAELFNGNTSDDRGERLYFDIVHENGNWKFKDRLMPAWLTASEEAVVQKVMEHMRQPSA
jgi:hypothetical protein